MMPRSRQPEILDYSTPTPEIARRVAGYLAFINRWLGVTGSIARRIEPRSTVLDVACGGGDIIRTLRRKKIAAFAVGLDRSAQIPNYARVPRVRGDAFHLPLADRSVDYVISSHFLHHLNEEEVVRLLRECDRVARRGIVISDLLRSQRALWWIRLFTLTANPVVRHDGLLSVRRAYTLCELESLIARAKIPYLRVDESFAHHFIIIGHRWI